MFARTMHFGARLTLGTRTRSKLERATPFDLTSGVNSSREDRVSQANIAIAQTLYAAFGRGDLGTILDGCTPDVEWHSGGQREDFPLFGLRKGKAEVQEFFRTLTETQDFDEFTPQDFYADRDKVFVLGRYAMTLKKNGRKAASEWVHIFTFQGGKVAKFREFMDSAAYAAAFRD
jgi:hypothetical protein